MKKLRIDPDQLCVDSFVTSAAPAASDGAVHAYVGTVGEPWQSLCRCPLGWSYQSCPDVSCGCPTATTRAGA